MTSNLSEHNITAVNDFPEIPLGKLIGISVGVFASTGILINTLVLVVVLTAQRLRFTAYKYLMCHLAFADLMCSIMLCPYVPLELAQHNWIYENKDACQLIYPMISCFSNVATGTIVLISVERFRGIVYPHRNPWQPRDVRIAFCIVWMASVGLVLPNAITLRINVYNNIDYCNEHWDNLTVRKVYGFSYFAFAFAVPLIGIAIMHVIMMIRLKSPELRPDNLSESQERQNTRIMRVLTGIIIAFFVCVCPNKILYFVWDLDPELEMSTTSKARFYMRTFQVLYYARVAADPLIYCFFDTRFKKDFKQTVRVLRGKSMADEKRSRTASQRTSTILTVRSRANSSFISDTPESNGSGKQISLACIKEDIHISPTNFSNGYVRCHVNGGLDVTFKDLKNENELHYNGIPVENKLRSDSVDTSLSSEHSSSPLVYPTVISKI